MIATLVMQQIGNTAVALNPCESAKSNKVVHAPMTSQKRINEIDSISVKYFLTGWFRRKRNTYCKIHDETVNPSSGRKCRVGVNAAYFSGKSEIYGKIRITIISELLSC